MTEYITDLSTYVSPATSWWCERHMHATCTEYSRLPCKCDCHPEIIVSQWCFDDDHDECDNHPDPCDCACHPFEEEDEPTPYLYETSDPALPDEGDEINEEGITWWCERGDHEGCLETPFPCECDCHPYEDEEEE